MSNIDTLRLMLAGEVSDFYLRRFLKELEELADDWRKPSRDISHEEHIARQSCADALNQLIRKAECEK